jgi:hypothetical protein
MPSDIWTEEPYTWLVKVLNDRDFKKRNDEGLGQYHIEEGVDGKKSGSSKSHQKCYALFKDLTEDRLILDKRDIRKSGEDAKDARNRVCEEVCEINFVGQIRE